MISRRKHIVRLIAPITLLFLVVVTSVSAQWVKLSQFNGTFYNEVYFASATLGFITSHSGTIYRTTDGGDSWNTVSLPDASSSSNRDVAFPTTQTGFISGEDGIWKTTDGGATWSEVTPAGATGISSSSCWFRNANVGVWGYGNCRDTIVTFWRTTDGGSSWSVTRDTSATTDVAVGGMTYSGGEFKVSGGSGKFWRSTDDGATWIASNTGSGGWQEDLVDNQGTLLIASANGTSCASTGGGKIMRSTDGGSNWGSTPFASVVTWGVSMYSGTNGVVVGDRGAAFLTTDGGATWTTHSCGLNANDRLDDVFMISSSNGFAVGDGVYRYRLDTFATVPDTIDFGNVVVGSLSPYQNAILRSIGTAGTITGRAFGGADAGSFTSNANFGLPLPVPACLDAPTPVRFEPTRSGSHVARFDMTLGGGAGTYSVVLLGNGVRPRMTSADTLWFDTIRCETEGTDSIEIRNLGNHELVIQKIDIANDLGFFSLLSPSIPLTIPPFSSDHLVFRARAVDTGRMEARVYLTTNDPDYIDSTRVIYLRMVRKPSALDETPDTVRIPSARFGESSSLCIELTNSIDTDISITGIPSVENVPEITVNLSGDPRIGPGSARELCFTGAAMDSIDRCETFLLRTSPCQNERTIVVCYQARPAGLDIPAEVSLTGRCGEDLVDSFMVSNDGDFDVRVDSIRLIGPSGTLDYSGVPGILRPGESLPVELRLDGRGRGSVSGLVVIHSDGGPDTVRLRADWVGPDLEFAEKSLVADPICTGDTLFASIFVVNRGEERGDILLSIRSGDPGQLTFTPQTREPGDSLPLLFGISDLPVGKSAVVLYLDRGCGEVDSLLIDATVNSPPLEFADTIIDLQNLLPGSSPAGFDIDVLNLSGLDADGVTFEVLHPAAEVTVPSGPVTIAEGGSILEGVVDPGASGSQEALIVIHSDLPCHVSDTLRVRWRTGVPEADVRWTQSPVDGGCDSVVEATITVYAPEERNATFVDVRAIFGRGIEVIPSAGPIEVSAGDSLDVKVTLRFSGEPVIVDTLLVRVDTLLHSFPLRISWERPRTVRVDASGSPVSGPIELTRFAGCDAETSMFHLRNDGERTDSLRIISSDPSALEVEPSRLIILPGEIVDVGIKVGPVGPGESPPTVRILSDVCGDEMELPVSITTVEGPVASGLPIDLGIRCRDSLSPILDTIRLSSQFPLDAMLEDITIDGDGTWSISRYRLLQDRSGIEIELIIGTDAPDEAVLALSFSSPCESVYLVPIHSTGVDCRKSDLVLEVGSGNGRWGEIVELPVTLIHRGGPVPREVPIQLEFDSRFLDILRVDPVSGTPWLIEAIDNSSASGQLGFSVRDSGLPTGELPRRDTILIIRAQILRGPVSHTEIKFDTSTTAENATIIWLNGTVALEDYCDAEGRLLQVTGEPGFRSVLPNPTDRLISVRYFIPVLAPHTISVVNVAGQTVYRIETGELPPGERIEEIDLGSVATGQYFVVIEAGRFRFTEEIYKR